MSKSDLDYDAWQWMIYIAKIAGCPQDIQGENGENVSIYSRCCKSILLALGTLDAMPPTDAKELIQKIIEQASKTGCERSLLSQQTTTIAKYESINEAEAFIVKHSSSLPDSKELKEIVQKQKNRVRNVEKAKNVAVEQGYLNVIRGITNLGHDISDATGENYCGCYGCVCLDCYREDGEVVKRLFDK